MRTLRMRQLALVLSAAAIALPGCGGQGKRSASSTPGGTGTSGTGPSSFMSPNTPVTSTSYKTALASRLAQIPGLPTRDIPKIVACAVQKLQAQGLKTVGEVHAHSSQASLDGQACAKALGLH